MAGCGPLLPQVRACTLALVLAVLCGACLRCLEAVIETAELRQDARQVIPLSQAFTFGKNGRLDLQLSGLKLYEKKGSRRANKRNNAQLFGSLGFLLETVDQEVEEFGDQLCPLKHPNPLLLFDFNDKGLQRLYKGEAKNFTHHQSLDDGGTYYLYFVNCEEDLPVSFNAHIQMYYNKADGKRRYLSLSKSQFDTVYLVSFGLFMALAAVWAYTCSKSKGNVQRIHYMMLVLVVLRALSCLSQGLMFYFLDKTGKPDGWNVVYYIFTFCRGMLFFTVVILIGTGWSYMKPFIGDNEKKILMVVLPLQVFANIAIIITGEENPSGADWLTWFDILHLVDIICCCAVLFPIVWSIKHLREASHSDGKAARNLEKLTLFRQFYISVVVYIYFTRIVVYLLRSTVVPQLSWLSVAAEECATLAFYAWVGLKFRPYNENAYLKLSQEEVEMA